MAKILVQNAQILDQRERDATKLNNEQQRKITQLNNQHKYDFAKNT